MKKEYSTQNKCRCGCGKWAIKGREFHSAEHCLEYSRSRFHIRQPKIIYNKSWA